MAARARRLAEEGNPEAADEFLLTDPGDKSKYESVQMWHGNVLDVGRDSTYRFLDVVIGELADMYRRAGVPLTTIHLGGDEVPEGAWLASPACESIATTSDQVPTRGQQLQLHFLDRACEIVAKHDLRPACWEDCLLFGAKGGATIAETRAGSTESKPIVYVWNNVWGWGREDAAYRLANAGYDVVLANATNLYFDFAQEKDPEEPGYYWAAFVGAREPFEFNPLDVLQNVSHDSMGHPMSPEQFREQRAAHRRRPNNTCSASKANCGARICAARSVSNTWRFRERSPWPNGLGQRLPSRRPLRIARLEIKLASAIGTVSPIAWASAS